jgi:predicted transcriptional regulator
VLSLVRLLPAKDLPTVEAFLRERLEDADPLTRALVDAPEDDEPLTPEDEAEIREGIDAIAAGDVIPHHELRRSLGL